MDLPIAPPLSACDSEEYAFVISSGQPGTPSGLFQRAIERGILMQIDVHGLDASDFWHRGGPILWYHEPWNVLGRTMSLQVRDGQLEAVARFLGAGRTKAHEIAARVRSAMNHFNTQYAASIGFKLGPNGDWSVNSTLSKVTIHKAVLIEWSVLVTGQADPGAISLGRVERLQG